jgi:hypothetical protein
MQRVARRVVWKLLPLAAAVALLVAWFFRVEDNGAWATRNAAPPVVVLLLSAAVLVRGGGRFTANGWREPLAVAGFAVPAVGLSAYLHYAYAVNLDGMFAEGPGELFRFLPVYTSGAGAIGAVIGWIVGRNVT